MKGETVRPRITGKANMKLVEKKLETSQKEGNVMTHMNGNNFGHKVIVEGSARTNFSTVIDATCHQQGYMLQASPSPAWRATRWRY